MTAGPSSRRPRTVVAGFAVTETVSWGILYYAFAVLIPAMERDLGWSRTTLVGAFTTAVIVSGLAAFWVGRWLDHGSARLLMTAGSALGVIGVVTWSQAGNVVAFYGAWLLIGIAMSLVLYEPAQVVLVKHCGAGATRAITTVTLAAGFASTIFQPLTAALEDGHGWRDTLVVLAVVLGVVTITIHATLLPGRPEPAEPRSARSRTVGAALRAGGGDRALVGLTIAFTLCGGALGAAVVHLIPYLTDHGWTGFRAAVAAGVLGATQVAARLVLGPAAQRLPVSRLALVVLGVPAIGTAVLAASGGSALAWVAVALLGAGQGTTSLLRPMVLAQRLTAVDYGRGAATSAAWSTVARAVAPLGLAAIAGIGSAGYPVGFALFVAIGMAGAVIGFRSLREPAPVPRAALD